MFGVPAGALPVERETEYADRFRKVTRLMEAGKLRDARAAVDAARKDFPACPALEVLSCELDARQNRFKPAEKACTHALSVMPASTARALSTGTIQAAQGARDGAIAAFRKSIEIDPKESAPTSRWPISTGCRGRRTRWPSLKVEYQKVFSKPLR
jgi:predicted Zn-dependent protease